VTTTHALREPRPFFLFRLLRHLRIIFLNLLYREIALIVDHSLLLEVFDLSKARQPESPHFTFEMIVRKPTQLLAQSRS
jgi:hypothetical protein